MFAKILLSFPLFAASLSAADAPKQVTDGQSATEAREHMQVPPGFSVDLIAGEPDVVQPIAMCFDSRGRLWVAEGLTYPQRAPEGQGQDKILIFEDTDGDGIFDSHKVFAEHLNLVSGMEVGFGGVFVGAAPYLLFIPDANGDDIPDSAPQVLLDGFGYQDTHETLNSFIWGPDGWLWGCHGVFTNSKVGAPGTADDKRVPLNAGVWRFDPRTKNFEVVAHGTSNPWGLDFNDWGDAFIEACVIPHLWNIIPGGHYERQAGSDFNPAIYDPIKTIADHLHYTGNIADHAHWGGREGGMEPASVSEAGGGHAHSGFAICLSDAFPPGFRNTALFFNIHGHRMNHDLLERNGSGWVGKHGQDLLMSYDQWFLGVSIRPGPDGALYFNDWYDATSCHRPDPQRWDRSNGRLYRLRHGDLKPWNGGNLSNLKDQDLALIQSGRNEWALRAARRILEERAAAGQTISPDAVRSLHDILDSNPDDTRKLRALWTLRAAKGLKEEDVVKLLDSPSEHLRGWAVRIASEDQLSSALSKLPALAAKEASPVAQLALCSAMQRIDSKQVLEIAAQLSPKLDPQDPNLLRMLWFGMERVVPAEPAKALAIATSAQGDALCYWTARRLEGAEGLDALFAALKKESTHQDWLLKAIAARLERNAGEKLSPANAAVLASLNIPGDTVARDLAARAGDPSAVERLWVAALDSKKAGPERLAAMKILTSASVKSEERWKELLADSAVQLDAMELHPALLDLPEAETVISGLSLEQKSRVARLTVREGKIDRMLGWIDTGRIRKPEVPADVVARLREAKTDEQKKQVIAIFGEVRAGAAEREAQKEAWRKKLTPEVLAQADPHAGRAVFERTCGVCHRLFGEGGQVGPELTGGDRMNLNHWLDNVLDPNALIGQGYELHELTKKDGSTVTGMLAGDTKKEYILKMVGVETRVPKKEVATDKALGISMMPEGLFNSLSDEDVANLIKYLSGPAQVTKP